MSEEINYSDVKAAYEYIYKDKQYYDYLYRVIGDIAFLSLWNVCLLIARNMVYEGKVPDCIQGFDFSLAYEAIESNLPEAAIHLIPIQTWLSEQIAKSIDKNEIKPTLIGRFIDGTIDTKRTFVNEPDIDDWLSCRGIEATYDDLISKGFPPMAEKLGKQAYTGNKSYLGGASCP